MVRGEGTGDRGTGDEGCVAPTTTHAVFTHLFVPQCLLYPPHLFVPLRSPPTHLCSFVLSLVLIYMPVLFSTPILPSYLVAAAAVAAPAPATNCHCCCSAITVAVAIATTDAACTCVLSLVVWFVCTHPVLALCSISGTSAPPLTCNSIISILCSICYSPLYWGFRTPTKQNLTYCTCTCGGGESESKDLHMALHSHIWLCHTVT